MMPLSRNSKSSARHDRPGAEMSGSASGDSLSLLISHQEMLPNSRERRRVGGVRSAQVYRDVLDELGGKHRQMPPSRPACPTPHTRSVSRGSPPRPCGPPSGAHIGTDSDALIPGARCCAGRPCLEGSKSRNRLSENTRLVGFSVAWGEQGERGGGHDCEKRGAHYNLLDLADLVALSGEARDW